MKDDNEPSTADKSSQGEGGEDEEEGEAREQRASEYERERLLRIKENRARLEALGLLCPGSKPPQEACKGKKAASKRGGDDDEYRPSDEDRNDEDDDYEPLPTGSRQNLKPKGRKKISFSVAKTRKRPTHKGSSPREDELVDNDEASLQQAIALSLGSVTECSTAEAVGPSQNSWKTIRDAQLHGMTDKIKSQATSAKRKQRKLNSRRVQLTEDEVVAFFFSFDEVGKGHIALRDLQRMAIAHDFSWTEMEIALMIHCFDSDKDGKLSLEDFRKIVSRCNMLREPGNS